MPSRISGACTPCRSKKQKCSGQHPICAQCANSSIDCTWPEQRKRGPAKGYIEALESRLHNAESLLLAILPLVSDNVVDQASNVLNNDDDDDSEAIGGRRSSPPILNKKTGLDYWETFPIDTRRNIRKWQFDCEANSNHPNTNNIVKRYRSRTHSPASGSITSPRGSISNVSQPASWVQSMQPYVTQQQNPHQNQHQHQHQHQHHMQAGAAQQLLNLSNSRRDHWMAQHQASDGLQLDPHLLPQRSIPNAPQHIYAGNVQQSLFW